jgi:hypothetical protein
MKCVELDRDYEISIEEFKRAFTIAALEDILYIQMQETKDGIKYISVTTTQKVPQ